MESLAKPRECNLCSSSLSLHQLQIYTSFLRIKRSALIRRRYHITGQCGFGCCAHATRRNKVDVTDFERRAAVSGERGDGLVQFKRIVTSRGAEDSLRGTPDDRTPSFRRVRAALLPGSPAGRLGPLQKELHAGRMGARRQFSDPSEPPSASRASRCANSLRLLIHTPKDYRH
jgi:hypothetical protein